MAKFQITAPDGSQYEIEGENEQGAMQALQAHLGSQPPAQPDTGVNDGTVGPSFARGGTAMPEKPMFGGTDAGRSFGQGVANTVMFGFNDEAAAGLATLRAMLPGGNGKKYSEILDIIRNQDKADANAHPIANAAGMVTGGLAGGAGLAKSGLSLGANAVNAGQKLKTVAGMSALDGAGLGLLQGFGGGEGVEGRIKNAGIGLLGGGALGFAAPYAAAGISAAAKPLVAPLAARMNPDKFAGKALETAFKRSGKTSDEIRAMLQGAADDGQGVFTLADALGNPGQRLMSTVARTPSDTRREVVEQLLARQSGQGRRVQNALSEGFGDPMTAMQQEAATTALRRSQGNANYGAARAEAGAVNTTPAIEAIDNVIQPGVTPLTGTGANDGSVFGTLSKARGYLGDGNAQVSDFDRALLAKQEMDAILEGGGTAANLLRPARNALDDALAKASAPYAKARDTYRQQSQALEAVDAGRNAAKRGRVEDTIPVFQGMRPDQQAGFRAGYVDPLIEKVQGAATGVDKSRSLITDASAAEFPAFAQSGKSDQLMRRLERERTMFDTNQAALGGSKTADNAADMIDMAQIDPAMLGGLLRGDWKGAIVSAAMRGANEAKGQTPKVIEKIAKQLKEGNPGIVDEILKATKRRAAVTDGRRALVNSMMNNLGSVGAGRFGSP